MGTKGISYVFVWGSAFASVSFVNAQRYTVTDLGTLGERSSAMGINDRGEVVGWSSSPTRGFIWKNGVMQDLGDIGGTVIVALSINNAGQVVGYSGNHAFLWQNGVMGGLAGLGVSEANDINDSGQIVGHRGLGPDSAFLWQNGVVVELTEASGMERSEALGINDLGQVVGWHRRGGYPRAALWGSDGVTYLGPEGGIAYDINNSGQIVGTSHPRAVLWPGDGGMLDLDAGAFARPLAINDLGEVVGQGTDLGGFCADFGGWARICAFLYSNGLTTDINELIPPESGWHLETATDINNHGEIVGSGLNPDGEFHAFLLTPTNDTPRELVAFTYSPRNPSSGEKVMFGASESSIPEGTVASYRWDFGNGEVIEGSDLQQVEYRFRGAMNEPKLYRVTLSVQDDQRSAVSGAVEITVNPLEKVVPVKGSGYSTELTALYNWIETDENGKEIYIVSKIAVSSPVSWFAGAYEINIHDGNTGLSMWRDLHVLYGRTKKKTWTYPFTPAIWTGLAESEIPITVVAFPGNGNISAEVFSGIQVNGNDDISLSVGGANLDIGGSIASEEVKFELTYNQAQARFFPDAPVEQIGPGPTIWLKLLLINLRSPMYFR